MSIISASKVGGGLAKISSEGGMKFYIVIYIFCTAFYSIDSQCIQVKLKNFKVNHIIFAIRDSRSRFAFLYLDDAVTIQTRWFFKNPRRWGYFYADRGLSQTSAQASPATAILPTANPPRSHHKTT